LLTVGTVFGVAKYETSWQLNAPRVLGFACWLSDDLHNVEEVAATQNLGVDSGEAPEGVDRVELEELRQRMRKVLGGLVEFLDRSGEL
jgi:hypothetical protein